MKQPLKRWSLAMVVAAATGAACGPPPGPAIPAEWTPAIATITSPAGDGSAQPQITASANGVILSWFESIGSSTRLMFAERSGGKWSEPRQVAARDDFFTNWADLPSVRRLHDAKGTLLAHWLRRTDSKSSGYNIEIATSADEGRTWSPPFSPHHDGTATQHGFASFVELPAAAAPLALVWLDGRQTTPAQNPDDDAVGEMTLRTARYDASWHEQADEALDARVCDCCPTAAAATSDGAIVVYRDRTADEIRDISVARLAGGRWTPPTTIHTDGWRIDGCPVNGPAVSARGRGVAVAWFTAANEEGKAFVAFSTDGGATFAAPIRIDEAGALGRVNVTLAGDRTAVVSWIELANRRASIMMRRVDADGRRGAALPVADITSHRGTVYPRMAAGGGEIVIAWPDADDFRVKTAAARLP